MKTRKPRRLFTDEFRQQALSLLSANRGNVAATARQLDLAPPVLRSWRDAGQARPTRLPHSQWAAAPAGLCSIADKDAEVAKLRAANARLEMQCQILKLVLA